MLLQVFQDLLKPQWRAVLELLKVHGGLPVSELSKKVDSSYMAVKQHCEDLRKLGYLDRSRIPRTAVGRPEIFYSLSAKAAGVFPDAGVGFTLSLLNELKSLYGESAPDKVLFQYFESKRVAWQPQFVAEESPDARLLKLARLRTKDGCCSRCSVDSSAIPRLEEFHNPLQRIFESYPRAVAMESRMLAELLGGRVVRHELVGGPSGQPRVVFELSPF